MPEVSVSGEEKEQHRERVVTTMEGIAPLRPRRTLSPQLYMHYPNLPNNLIGKRN